MPSNIQDSNVVSYDNDSMNAFAAQGVDAVSNIMGDVGTRLGNFASGKTTFPNDDQSTTSATFDKLKTDLANIINNESCLLYTSPSPRDATLSRMPSSA